MNRPMLAALLLSLTTLGITPSADAEPYSAHCVGWWAWHWDVPQPGQVTVVTEPPGTYCGGYWTGCGGIPACAGYFPWGFTVSYGPGTCAPLFTAGWVTIVGGVLATGTFSDSEGDVWSIDGVFGGSTCLNQPTRGVFYISESGL